MKKLGLQVAKFMYFFSAMWVSMSVFAHAYIDPSATTYVIQAVGAVIIALGAVITVFRHKIAAIFKKGKTEEKKEIHFDEEEKTEE